MFFFVLCVTYPTRTTLLYSFWIVLWPLTIHNAIYSVISLLCAHHWRFNPVAQYRIGTNVTQWLMLNQKKAVADIRNIHCLYGPLIPVTPFLTSKLSRAFKIFRLFRTGIFHRISEISAFWQFPFHSNVFW